jgi:hypothetical protein
MVGGGSTKVAFAAAADLVIANCSHCTRSGAQSTASLLEVAAARKVSYPSLGVEIILQEEGNIPRWDMHIPVCMNELGSCFTIVEWSNQRQRWVSS